MTFIVPFKKTICGKTETVYSVNNDNPNNIFGSVTTSEMCPHCGERHIYQVYNPKNEYQENDLGIEVYDCKCAKCRREFDLKIKFKLD